MANAATGNHHYWGADQLGHTGIAQSQYRADAAVPGPFDNQEVAGFVEDLNGLSYNFV